MKMQGVTVCNYAKEPKYLFLKLEGNSTFPSCISADTFQKTSAIAHCSTKPALLFKGLGQIPCCCFPVTGTNGLAQGIAETDLVSCYYAWN